jgi:hypothetical protein
MQGRFRAKGKRSEFDHYLSMVPDVPAHPGDELIRPFPPAPAAQSSTAAHSVATNPQPHGTSLRDAVPNDAHLMGDFCLRPHDAQLQFVAGDGAVVPHRNGLSSLAA